VWFSVKFIFVLLFSSVVFGDDRQPAGYPPAGLELGKGKFLVASRSQSDPRFMQTVVLLIHHNQEGALGLIINYPTEIDLSKALPDLNAVKRSEEKLFFGGPVERSKVFLLLRSSQQPEESLRVFDHVYFSTSRNVLEERILNTSRNDKLRVFSGYSGWGEGQLEGEIDGGHWLVWHADSELIFDKPIKEVWPEMIRRTSVIRASRNLPQRAQRTQSLK
jgi:putative transcriptional regulator